MKRLHHNKKRNTALLMEFLVRHISKCLVENNKKEANKALLISKKYFGESCPLRKELDLFSSILKANVRTKESAQRIVDAFSESAIHLNARILDEQKSKLIKEINYTLSQEIYNYKIPNYTIYATLQTVVNEARNKRKLLEVVDRVKLEETLVEYLTKTDRQTETVFKVDPNYNNTVYNLLVQRFNKKYEGKINENQKKLLVQYAKYLISQNDQPLKEYLLKEVSRIKSSLSVIKDKSLTEDKDISNKLCECKNKFNSTDFAKVSEDKILEMLQYQELIAEVES